MNNNNRAIVEWVSIGDIIPNPLNPRKNDAIRSSEIQAIINKRGWEVPLTAYKKGSIYVLLAGHRRLYAAKKAGIKQIPVYSVDAPKDHQEEIERIASLQSGQVDWTSFEWGKFTYERWIAWDKPALTPFSKSIGLKLSSVKSYIAVFDYYPLHEIESGLKMGSLNFTSLHLLVGWLKSLEIHHHSLVQTLSIDMIRKVMIDKMASKKIPKAAGLSNKEFITRADDNLLREFIMNKNMSLDEALVRVDIDLNRKTFHGKLISLGITRKTVKSLDPRSTAQAKNSLKILQDMEGDIQSKIAELKNKYPDAAKTRKW
jgi:ParB family transcriptional regulator, chromosome partitioning protein